jgi:hypothetical protein
MATAPQEFSVGQIVQYTGVYRCHQEVAHIAVCVSRLRTLRQTAPVAAVLLAAFWLGMLNSEVWFLLACLALLVACPAEEWWLASFPADFASGLGHGEETAIVFEGIVSAPGSFGYLGLMRRRVQVCRVLRCDRSRRRSCSRLPWC